jgi:hypothetical protein
MSIPALGITMGIMFLIITFILICFIIAENSGIDGVIGFLVSIFLFIFFSTIIYFYISKTYFS